MGDGGGWEEACIVGPGLIRQRNKCGRAWAMEEATSKGGRGPRNPIGGHLASGKSEHQKQSHVQEGGRLHAPRACQRAGTPACSRGGGRGTKWKGADTYMQAARQVEKGKKTGPGQNWGAACAVAVSNLEAGGAQRALCGGVGQCARGGSDGSEGLFGGLGGWGGAAGGRVVVAVGSLG